MADGENLCEALVMSSDEEIDAPADVGAPEAVPPEASVKLLEAAANQASSVNDGDDDFDAPVTTAEDEFDALIVNLDGYEGPLDVLLDLARRQKVDIRRISMVALVDQYLAFVEEAKRRDLELAADYLVMAAWLAFLKSKLLLPADTEAEDEPTADEMAARLAFQLQRLEAMRNAVEALQARPQFGIDIFPRGAPEGVRVKRKADWQAELYDLLRAYATQRIAVIDREYQPDPPKVYSIEAARLRLERILGTLPDWTDLTALAKGHDIDAPTPSVIASAFNAALEFAKDGRIEIKQLSAFEPVYIKARGERDEKENP